MIMPLLGNLARSPDKIGPPLAYMEECRVFKPLDTMANPLGLCWFYRADPETAKSISALKHLVNVHRVKCLLEKAKGHGWPYIIVVFKGGNVTPLELFQELHVWFTLSGIPIFTADEAKWGQKPHVCCCPISAYIIKNDSAFLNHIVISHYWNNFVCGKCLDVIMTSDQKMKKHFLKYCGIADVCKKPDSQGSASNGSPLGSKSSKSHSSGESSSKSKKDKDPQCGDDKKGDKMCTLKETKTDGKAASRDEVQESLHRSSYLAGSSTAGGSQENMGKAPFSHQNHKKSKKCGKKSHKKSPH